MTAVLAGLEQRRSDGGVGLLDHKSDDNADDSCTPNYFYNTAFRLLNSLFSGRARFWQCGGHGFESR